MVQVKGMRVLVQRFRMDLAGSVKYSILWPSRRNWPLAARRAMPISFGPDWGSKGNVAMMNVRFLFAYDTPGDAVVKGGN
jgi:hypothetical protein